MALTIKQDGFCLSYIEEGNASEAYRLNYSTSNMKKESVNRNAKALMDNIKISTRIKELQAEHKKRHMVTVDSLTKELEEARALALQTEQSTSMVSATMGKAKLHGLITDKQRVEMQATMKNMNEIEIERRIAELSIKE